MDSNQHGQIKIKPHENIIMPLNSSVLFFMNRKRLSHLNKPSQIVYLIPRLWGYQKTSTRMTYSKPIENLRYSKIQTRQSKWSVSNDLGNSNGTTQNIHKMCPLLSVWVAPRTLGVRLLSDAAGRSSPSSTPSYAMVLRGYVPLFQNIWHGNIADVAAMFVVWISSTMHYYFGKLFDVPNSGVGCTTITIVKSRMIIIAIFPTSWATAIYQNGRKY